MSKRNRILQDLYKGDVISGATAMSKYGVYRLSSVIHHYRSQGHPIKTYMASKFSDGKQIQYAIYFIDQADLTGK